MSHHFFVFNKADLAPPARARALVDSRPGSLLVSARTGEGLQEVRQELLRRLDLGTHTVEPLADGQLTALMDVMKADARRMGIDLPPLE